MDNISAVCIGDTNGIGIHLLINIFKNKNINNFILFTNEKIIKNFIKKNNYKIKVNKIDFNKKNLNFNSKCLNIYSYYVNSKVENTYKSLKFAYIFCKKKYCIGIITLPLRKDLIKNKIDKTFVGHTEYFEKIDKKKYSNMILYHKKIIVTTLTRHIPLNKISNKITNKNYLINQILNINETLKTDFNIKNPKIAISGLNPHAGESGSIGSEEVKVIIPIIKKLKIYNVDITGPLSADSILLNDNMKIYNCFIFLYHDQALIPFKLISKFSGVNFTSNLSIIRTSPDHGTAYNLVGKNNASNISLVNCFKLVKKISQNRSINAKS